MLAKGSRRLEEKVLHLVKWILEVGCLLKGRLLRKLGEGVGTPFASVELGALYFAKATEGGKVQGGGMRRITRVAVGSSYYAIQLWWEVQPGVSEVASVIRNEMVRSRRLGMMEKVIQARLQCEEGTDHGQPDIWEEIPNIGPITKVLVRGPSKEDGLEKASRRAKLVESKRIFGSGAAHAGALKAQSGGDDPLMKFKWG
ncbi:hypothetical protein CK203_000069 [Vitis vinifera]|uniref:Uncharacterized protein n=1 Tax=Vitis vinifera TaxID=29760 RepID=A0A438KQP0_VITVI|nr:hypothetical protein CK203_000069 [Vitis vinifera]